MLSLDEAIKHCEEVAEKNEEECKNWAYGASQINDDENRKKQYQKHAEWWHERAKEHRQMAEWLRELEVYRKSYSCYNCYNANASFNEYPCNVCKRGREVTKNIKDYYEEANADEDSD